MNENIEELYRYASETNDQSPDKPTSMNRINPMKINFSSRMNPTTIKNKPNLQLPTAIGDGSAFIYEENNDLKSAPLYNSNQKCNNNNGIIKEESDFGSILNNPNQQSNKINPYYTSPSPYNNVKYSHYKNNDLHSTKSGIRNAKEIPKIVSMDSLNQAFNKEEEIDQIKKYEPKITQFILSWSTNKVKRWLEDNSLEKYMDIFLDNDVNGEVLFELSNSLLKQMGVKTVGERVKILNAIKKLKYEIYNKFKDDALNQDNNTHSIPEMSNRLSRTKKLTPDLTIKPQRSAGNLRVVESKNGQLSSKSFFNSTPTNPSPLSAQGSYFLSPIHLPTPPTTNQSPLSNYNLATPSPRDHETNIMNLDNVQKYCVRVVGDGGQVLVVNLKNALDDSKSIMKKVLAKFSLNDSPENYAIFVNSGASTKMLNDDELMAICNSISHPDKDKFILRKKYSPKSHLELQQERMKRLANQNNDINNKALLAGIEVETVNKSNGNLNRHSKLFANRPPSQQITSNLAHYFPIQNLNRHLVKKQQKPKKEEIRVQKPLKSSRSTKRNNIHKLGIDALPNLANLSPIHETFSDSEADPNKFLDGSPISSPTLNQPSIGSVLSNEKLLKPLSSPSSSELPKSPSPLASPNLDMQLLTPSSIDIIQNDEGDKNQFSGNSEGEDEVIKGDIKSESLPNLIINETDKMTKSLQSRISMDMEGWIQGALIGAGSFGSVYLGLNPITKLVMAVKQVELPTPISRSENRQKADQVASLEKEIDLMRELCHINIVQYLGSSSTETHLNIFLEYVPGGSVAARLAEKGKFTELRTRYYVSQLLNGLEYLHSHNIIHRDIKGGNVLIDDHDNVKIADFGVSKKVQDSVLSVITPQRVSLQGSVYWMAPEVVKQTHYTRKADIWSLGCLVIEMLTGDHPFPNFTQMQAIFKIGSYSAPDLPSDISDLASDFLTATLQPQHQNRPSSSILMSHPFVVNVPVPPSTPRIDKLEFSQFEMEQTIVK